MLCLSSPSSFAHLGPATALNSTTVSAAMASPAVSFTNFSNHKPIRYDHDRYRCSSNGCEMKMLDRDLTKRRRTSFPRIRTTSSSAYPVFVNQLTKESSRPKSHQETTIAAREKFTQEISFQSKDREISLAKALLYIAAEDEAFMAYNREMDARSLMNERKTVQESSNSKESDAVELITLAGKSVSEWLGELDTIAREVEAELISRDIGCHLVEVLEAVNVVLFDLRGFQRTPVVVDPKDSYLHSVLSCRSGSAFSLSIIYIEVCRRLGVPIVGSRVGEDFLIWPQLGYPEELFKTTSGQSLFAIVNGRCVEDPGSMASDLTGKSLLRLEIATNRDIIGIALANLIRLHWRRASRSNRGLMLTSPLRELNNISSSNAPLLRPQDLRLAIMASERLLILQPHNWALRRDHGMLLYYNRQYGEAVQELSICMAFAPEEEVEVLEPFVEKLHLLRLESSWKSFGRSVLAA